MAIGVTKHRTQIYLTDDQYRKVRKLAKKRDTSLANVVRDAVTRYTMSYRDEDEESFAHDRDAFLKLAGIINGPKNLARDHDKYWDWE